MKAGSGGTHSNPSPQELRQEDFEFKATAVLQSKTRPKLKNKKMKI
jgi:hypothetical protein